MNQAAQDFYDWWNVMANLNAKYGHADDIKEKPEWAILQEAQRKLFTELYRVTSVQKRLMFESLQHAMTQVLGPDTIVLQKEHATQIVDVAIALALTTESRMARKKGLMN